jgi:hypothetical protein
MKAKQACGPVLLESTGYSGSLVDHCMHIGYFRPQTRVAGELSGIRKEKMQYSHHLM